MTNSYQAGKLCIQKCEKCRDGYLIVKPGRDGSFFLGCTNYKKDGTGCNNTITKQAYYEMMGYKLESEQDGSAKEMQPRNESRNTRLKPESIKKWSPIKDKDYVEIQKAYVESVLYRGHDLNELVYHVLCGLQNVSLIHFYGVTILCEVLHGDSDAKLSKAGLDMVPEYGLYSDFPYGDIKGIIEWLIGEHYILQTKGDYPVLHSTYEGLHYSETITVTKLKKLQKYLELN